MALVVGCGTPRHTNVLIFATNTKAGIDISYDPKTQEPNLLVGYKRQEGVWMPLLANMGPDGTTPGVYQTDRVIPAPSGGSDPANTVVASAAVSSPGFATPSAPIQPDPANRDLQVIRPGHLYVGTQNRTGQTSDADTYSVLASFGAKFNAKGSQMAGPEASGGLAQYFATGLAARKLAEVGGARLVSVQPGDGVSEEVKELAAKALKQDYDDVGRIIHHVAPAGLVDEQRLSGLTPNTGLDEAWVKKFAGKSGSELERALKGRYISSVPGLVANIQD